MKGEEGKIGRAPERNTKGKETRRQIANKEEISRARKRTSTKEEKQNTLGSRTVENESKSKGKGKMHKCQKGETSKKREKGGQ